MTTSYAGTLVTTRMLPPSASPLSSSGGLTSSSITSKPRGPWHVVRLGKVRLQPSKEAAGSKEELGKWSGSPPAPGGTHPEVWRSSTSSGLLRAENGLDTLSWQ